MEIMLNKSFIGSWGVANDENIPHEIINLFRSDNGKIYIYVPPYGGFKTNEHPDVQYILLTGSWNNNMTEVFYVVKGLTLLHHGGRKATKSDRAKLVDYIKAHNIKYGGKFLHEIKMAEAEEEIVFYMTFEAEAIYKPKKPLFLSWEAGSDSHTEEKDVYELSVKDYKYQRQIGYIPRGDSNLVKDIIESDLWDTENSVVQSVSPVGNKRIQHTNFLQLVHKEYDETIYSNLLYEFFRTTPGLLSSFAAEVLEIPGETDFTISKEVTTKDGKGRIDLLVENDNYVIVIENKINSGLNGIDKHNRLSQLTTYIEFVEAELLNGRSGRYFIFEPDYNDIDISRFDKRRGEEFDKIQYSLLYDFFKKQLTDLKVSSYGQYAEDFVNALYIHTLLMKDVVMQRFTEAIQK